MRCQITEPILTYKLLPQIIEAAKHGYSEVLKKLVKKLPDANRDTLAFIIVHLQNVITNSKKNQMSQNALGKKRSSLSLPDLNLQLSRSDPPWLASQRTNQQVKKSRMRRNIRSVFFWSIYSIIIKGNCRRKSAEYSAGILLGFDGRAWKQYCRKWRCWAAVIRRDLDPYFYFNFFMFQLCTILPELSVLIFKHSLSLRFSSTFLLEKYIPTKTTNQNIEQKCRGI